MRWTPGGVSGNIEDRRGAGGGGFRMGGSGLGIGGTLVLAVLSLVFGRNFFDTTEGPAAPPRTAAEESARSRQEEPVVEFVSFVLDDSQNTWRKIFASSGREYQDAKLVLFRDAVESACGVAGAASGPFYCPVDQKAYIDLSFFEELRRRFGAPGDFAQAYVLAHEIGHHVQHQLGIDRSVRRAQSSSPSSQNALSVRLELQADCLAGVWGHSTAQRNILESGDVEEGLGAAAAIGDDRIQGMTRGRVSPESFTHGSSEERVRWFRQGLESGDVRACDTFAGR